MLLRFECLWDEALLALLHFYWKRSGKHNFDDVWVYGGIIALLLGWRLWRRLRLQN